MSHLRPNSLLDLEELDIEGQGAVGRDAWDTLAAVGVVSGNGQSALATDGHASNADVPSLDDLALSELEGEWCPLLVCCVALSALMPCGLHFYGAHNLQSKTLPLSSLPM